MNASDQVYPIILRWDRIAGASLSVAQIVAGLTVGWFALEGNPHLDAALILAAWATSLKIIVGSISSP